MTIDTLQKITPEIIGIIVGILIRHFVPSIFTGKQTQEFLKYLKKHSITKDEIAEIKFNLEQTRYWIELHTNACPHIQDEITKTKIIINKILEKG